MGNTETYQTPKTGLLSFHHRSDPEFFLVTMNGNIPNEAPCFECLLDIKFVQSLEWSSYKEYITEDIVKIISLLYRAKNYKTSSEMLYLKK